LLLHSSEATAALAAITERVAFLKSRNNFFLKSEKKISTGGGFSDEEWLVVGSVWVEKLTNKKRAAY
jgi:hypothetical protein